MKNILAIISLTICSVSYAKSTVTGTWINGGETLSVQIIDDPSHAPFTACDLWKSMAGQNGQKTIKTQNLILTCDALQNSHGKAFVSCQVSVNKAKIDHLGSGPDLFFSIFNEEAQSILAKMNRPSTNQFVLVYGNDEFNLEANWQKEAFGFFISHELIQH